MKILIGADLVPTKSNEQFFINCQIDQIVDSRLMNLLRDSDYRIFNLETPLTDTLEPIKKCGPNLIAATSTCMGIKQLGVDFFTLANNHIMDQGEAGLLSTIRVLEQFDITYGGAGKTIEQACKPNIIHFDNCILGIYCCAEHEFSIADEKHAGANPFDPLESLDHIFELKKQCDYVICLYHGGKEHYRYPSPGLQRVCRKIIDKGADLVVCQHSHCVGCEENWNNGTIVYGQGNFLFDNDNNEFWQTSILIDLDLIDRKINYIPIKKKGNSVVLADEADAKKILDEFRLRSGKILDSDFVENMYQEFSKNMIEIYFSRDIPFFKSILFRILNRMSRGSILKNFTSKRISRYRTMYINQYECEAHRELIITGLKTNDNV